MLFAESGIKSLISLLVGALVQQLEFIVVEIGTLGELDQAERASLGVGPAGFRHYFCVRLLGHQ